MCPVNSNLVLSLADCETSSLLCDAQGEAYVPCPCGTDMGTASRNLLLKEKQIHTVSVITGASRPRSSPRLLS